MPAARCSICAANFGTDWIGRDCPICLEEELDGIRNAEPDEEAELHSRVMQAEFERYYERTRGFHPDTEEVPDAT